MQVVGLSGFARSGKDATAKVLVEKYGFTQVAFADKLREFLYAMDPYVSGGFDSRFGGTEYRRVQSVIDTFGWDGYKESPYGPDIRRSLQRLGTEAGRQTLWDTIWIDAAFAGLPDDAKVVVSDARFFNEFDAVRERGGEVWRIERPGVGPANDHASEMEAITYEFDRTINNSRDLSYLEDMIDLCYRDYVLLRKPRNVPTELNEKDAAGLRTGPANGNPAGPRKGDGSITSVNVPKRR